MYILIQQRRMLCCEETFLNRFKLNQTYPCRKRIIQRGRMLGCDDTSLNRFKGIRAEKKQIQTYPCRKRIIQRGRMLGCEVTAGAVAAVWVSDRQIRSMWYKDKEKPKDKDKEKPKWAILQSSHFHCCADGYLDKDLGQYYNCEIMFGMPNSNRFNIL